MRLEATEIQRKDRDLSGLAGTAEQESLFREFSHLLDQIARRAEVQEKILPVEAAPLQPAGPEVPAPRASNSPERSDAREPRSPNQFTERERSRETSNEVQLKERPESSNASESRSSSTMFASGERVVPEDEAPSTDVDVAVPVDSAAPPTREVSNDDSVDQAMSAEQLSSAEVSQAAAAHASQAHNAQQSAARPGSEEKATPEPQQGEKQEPQPQKAIQKELPKELGEALTAKPSGSEVEVSPELKELLLKSQPITHNLPAISELVQKVLSQIRGDTSFAQLASSAASVIATSSSAGSVAAPASGHMHQLAGTSDMGVGLERQARTKEQQRPMSSADAARTLKRVQDALEEAAKSRDGKQISLRLDPPNLGKVNVDISLRDGTLHARLFAEQAQVMQLLRDKAHELQRMLRDLGLHVDEITIAVSQDPESFDSLAKGFEQRSAKDRRGGAEQRGGELGEQDPSEQESSSEIAEQGWVA